MKEVTEVPEMGWLSIIVDPTGAILGLWETAERKTDKRPRKKLKR
jgi:predicted enzyme related to lactoylglutathione lyase